MIVEKKITKTETEIQKVEIKLPAYFASSFSHAAILEEETLIEIIRYSEANFSIHVQNKNSLGLKDNCLRVVEFSKISNAEVFWKTFNNTMELLKKFLTPQY